MRKTIFGCHALQRRYTKALEDYDNFFDGKIKKETDRLNKTKLSGYFQVAESLVSGKKRDMTGFKEAY
jgi:hypothetical protein